jgi:hypothetical protein
MLEGESFRASLVLTSMAQQDVTNISVDLVISDTTGADASDLFTIVPAPPTGLGDLGAGEEVAGEWLIVPRVAVTDSGGRDFFVQAVVDYDFNGARRFTTLPERITVFPAPELEIDYQLPEAGLVCTVFDLKATVRNVGVGAARGLRLTSSQPRIVESSGGTPQSFEIVGVWANGEPVANTAMEVALGDIAPGGSGEVVWRIRAAQPGQFTAFTSDYRMLNYQGLALAPSLRAINTTFAPPDDLAFYGCNASPGPYSISGYVVNEEEEPIEGIVVVSDAGPYATTNTDGFYTIAGVGNGTYTLRLGNIGPDLSPFFALPPLSPPLYPPCDDLSQPECIEQYVESLRSLRPYPRGNHVFVQNENADGGTTEVTRMPIPDPPTTGFKGANWLRYADPTDPLGTGTDYQEMNIGWNLETAESIDIDPSWYDLLGDDGRAANLAQEVADFRNLRNVYTIIRLQTPPPADPTSQGPHYDGHNRERTCDDLNGWMEQLDAEVDSIINHPAFREATPRPIQIFVLGNEPNHFKDEWNYFGSEYAHLYNCYYQHWIEREELRDNNGSRLYALYAAGPGMKGPCEKVLDHLDETGHPVWARDPANPNEFLYQNCTGNDTEGYIAFYEEMLITGRTHPSQTKIIIDNADGFAIHAYGYDNLGTDFNAWLSNGIDRIRTWQTNQGLVDDVPIIVTEYNPGATPTKVNPPAVNWQDWFNRTYCWTKAYGDQVKGLLYFVDEPDHWRHNEDNLTGLSPETTEQLRNLVWWSVSLRNPDLDPNRRTYWLNVGTPQQAEPYYDPAQACSPPDRPPGDPAPVIGDFVGFEQNQRPQSYQADTSIGGVISGTLGTWGYHDVYTVTSDLEVLAGQTLTIAPGTSLVFEPGRRMEIAGQLVAKGNSVYPIRFLSNNEAGWSGLHFQTSSQGSQCIGCYLENIETGGTALQADAPLTLKRIVIRGVPEGTAISGTVPLTLSNVWVDYVGTGLYLTGTATSTHTASHLTLTRCEKGVVNHGQMLALVNSILAGCEVAVSTELSGTTAISYSLLYGNGQGFGTQAGSQLMQGSGLITAAPGFVHFPNNVHLLPGSPAVNAADPQADYSWEPGYNGNRADLGVYGNTQEATEQPPLEQMAVTIEPGDTMQRTGGPGQTITYTLTVRNSGSITDTYKIKVYGSGGRDPYFSTSLYEAGHNAPQYLLDVAPQEQISITVWVGLPLTTTWGVSDTISVEAIGKYGIQDQVVLTTTISSFQEAQGQVVMEAEHFAWRTGQSDREWITQMVLADYTGLGYASALPDTDVQFPTSYTAAPELHYTINLTTTGVYTIWLRGYAPNAAGDSLYVSLDDQPQFILSGFTPRKWSWANSDTQGGAATIAVVKPGLHTLNLRQREDGLRLDRIVLTTYSEYNPSGNGPPESEIR